MLVEMCGPVPGSPKGTHDDRADLPTAVCVVVHPLVPGDYQNAVRLEFGASNQWSDVCLCPGIGLCECAVMPVINQVRRDESDLREAVMGNISRERVSFHDILFLRRIVLHIGKEDEHVMLVGVTDAGRVPFSV